MNITILIFVIVISLLRFDYTNAMDIDKEIEKRLKHLNKFAVKSIKSDDGDIIDCVNIYNQPAFDHPTLKNHTIQMKPPAYMTQDINSTKRSQGNVYAFQTWRKSGSCPKGTIPIRRVRRQDLLRTISLDHYGKKNEQVYNKTYYHFKNVNGSKLYGVPNRSEAFVFTSSYNFIGAQGEINVKYPQIDLPDDYSSSQIWLKHNEEFIESGWIVNPKLYGDRETRFFGTWTVDSHRSTGCFDLTCPGFVQVDKNIALGAAISKVAVQEGRESVLGINLDLDTKTGNWWLRTNGVAIGYWPKSLFSRLYYSAIILQWGGEVYSTNLKTSPHTKTHMGSGEFADGLGASFIRNIKIKDNSGQMKDPPFPEVYTDEYDCYTAEYNISEEKRGLFYGGPGGDSSLCSKN